MEQKKFLATDAIESAVNSSSADRMIVADLIAAMNGAGFGLAILIFALGVVIPLPPPLPGLIAIPLIIFAVQMIAGCHSPKLPKFLANFAVKRSVVATVMRKANPFISRVEKVLRPRLSFMLTPVMERIVGIFIFIFASFIFLPMPLSNFIPGVGILMISFGLVGRDGLAVLCGITTGIVGISISIAAVLVGVEAFHYIKDWLF